MSINLCAQQSSKQFQGIISVALSLIRSRQDYFFSTRVDTSRVS